MYPKIILQSRDDPGVGLQRVLQVASQPGSVAEVRAQLIAARLTGAAPVAAQESQARLSRLHRKVDEETRRPIAPPGQVIMQVLHEVPVLHPVDVNTVRVGEIIHQLGGRMQVEVAPQGQLEVAQRIVRYNRAIRRACRCSHGSHVELQDSSAIRSLR